MNMIHQIEFKQWLICNTSYTKETISDTVSRVRRADAILPFFDDPVYQFRLEQIDAYQGISGAVKSQIKRAVKQYFTFLHATKVCRDKNNTTQKKVVSLFSNIGVAEAYLHELGFEAVIANEIIERRALLYSRIYPSTNMICGDITDQKTYDRLVALCKEEGIDVLMATPPCQGMSTAGQQNEDDERNKLICPVVELIKQAEPKYVFLENVSMFLQTSISVNGEDILIPALLERELRGTYTINEYIINTQNYSVPQTRERAIFLMTRKGQKLKEWCLPAEDEQIITMRDAIGTLPSIDPYVTDVSESELLDMFPHYYEREKAALDISSWHRPPHHVKRQVVAMQHTPTGCTAFDNAVYYPVKEDGSAVRGYRNTYKRQNWDTPAYTVTMDNRKISSQNNVHPGHYVGMNDADEAIYSDARTLTLYELMKVMSLPDSWPVPKNTSEAFLRRIIGEGIPPLFVKKVFSELL